MTEHTPPPWGWFGNQHGFQLATPDRGRQFVMTFARMGMQGAQPRFQTKGRMVNAADLVRFEVDRTVQGMVAGKAAPSVYRYDIIDIDHPDARLIAAAPDLLEALADIMREYRHIMGDDTGEILAAYAAIAKATGND